MFHFMYFYIMFIFRDVPTFIIFIETLEINLALASVSENVYPGLEWYLLYLRHPEYVMKYGMYW